jgi:hypothetical protein
MSTSSFLKRVAATAALSATLAAPGVVGLTAGTADARPISDGTIKSECGAAGGRYSTYNYDGSRHSLCSYTAINGGRYTDHYEDGVFVGTSNDWPTRIPRR